VQPELAARDLRWSTVLLLGFDTATPAVTVVLGGGERENTG
jgi:hypothetical protein